MPRVSLLEQELAKERRERAADSDTLAEMLVRVTSLESRAKSAEGALAQAERDAETKVRAAKEQGGGLVRKLEDAEGRIAELESELRTARARGAAAEKSSDRARETEERSLELLDRVSSLQAELTSVQQVAADLQSKLEEAEEKLTSVEDDLTVAREKLIAADERRKELEESLGNADDKVRGLVAERARVDAEHTALVARHSALEKELATTREHYDKALAEARRTESTRVAALEAKNEDTRKVLEGQLDGSRKSLAAEEKSHADLRAVLEAVQAEAATTSAKLTEVSQERDRVSSAMTSLAERVSTLETRETTLFSQIGAATSAFQRANAVFDDLEAHETEQAQRRVQDHAALREALRTSFAGLPGRRSPARRNAPPSMRGAVVDVTDEAELVESLRPPRPPSSAPESSDGWEQPGDGDAKSDDEPEE
ncbi:MAG: hypothetical protein ABI175_15700 [Polyangiales bacterium]